MQLFAIKAEDKQKLRWVDILPINMTGYQLDEEHAHSLWQSFKGENLEQKLNDCADFAKKLGLDSPNDFCAKLFLMVANDFPGLIKFMNTVKQEATKSFRLFSEYVEDFIRMHERSPLPIEVYHKKAGRSFEEFIQCLKNACNFSQNTNELIIALNSIIPRLGEVLFSAWVTEQKTNKKIPVILEKIASVKKQFLRFMRLENGNY